VNESFITIPDTMGWNAADKDYPITSVDVKVCQKYRYFFKGTFRGPSGEKNYLRKE
jgi:hypothetical protein